MLARGIPAKLRIRSAHPDYLTQLSVVKEKRYGFRCTLEWVLEEIATSNRRFLLNQRDSLKTLGRILFTNPPHRRPQLAVVGFSGSRVLGQSWGFDEKLDTANST